MSEEQKAAYLQAYNAVATAVRQLEIAEAELKSMYRRLLIEYDVPAGHGIDIWGDGAIKKKAELAQPPEVN